MIKSLYDLKDNQSDKDRMELYDCMLVLLGNHPRWNENKNKFEAMPPEERPFLKYRLKGYSSREIANVLVDAIMQERDSHMYCERLDRRRQEEDDESE